MSDVMEEIKERAAQKLANQTATAPNTPSKRGSNPGQTPKPAPDLTPFTAGTLGQSGSDTPVPVGNTLETTGHAKPGTTDTPDVAPAAPPIEPVNLPIQKIPAVSADGPTTKQMISKVLSGPGQPTAQGTGPSFAGLLQGAGSKLGDFLQRWGMSLAGAPTGATQGDIMRQQGFEMQKAQMQAQIQSKQIALENQYQQQRMQLQNQMNMANLPIEKKAELQNAIATLDAQYQNEMRILPARIQQEMAIRGMSPGNYSMNTWTGGK